MVKGSAPTSVESSSSGVEVHELFAVLGVGFERSVVPMLVIDNSLRVVVHANPAALAMLAADSLVGRMLTEFSTSDRTSGNVWESEALAGGQERVEAESELLTDNGLRLPVRVHCEGIVLFGTAFFLVQCRDLSPERDLPATNELRFLQLAASLPDASIFMFDRDLRLLLVLGEAVLANGYDPVAMTGQLLPDVFADNVLDILDRPCRAALAGQHSDFDYTSPLSGRQFRLRVRPVTGRDNEIIGGLAIDEDVSADRVRRAQLEQVHRLNSLGSCFYDRRTGWVFDQELLDLWGVDEADAPVAAVADLLVGQDQEGTIEHWTAALTEGGRSTTPYRIHHGRTGQIRHLLCAYEAVVDADHQLVRAVATHVDVTAVVEASETAEHAKITAAQSRAALVRRVSESIATNHWGIDELLLTIAELASAALNAAVMLWVLTPNQRTVEWEVTANEEEPARLNLDRIAGFSANEFAPGGIAAQVIGRGRMVSTIGIQDPELLRQFGEMACESSCFVVAPVRHDGLVLGLLAVSRNTPDTPLEPVDADLVQVLADRAGAAVAEGRAVETAARGRRERDAVVDQLRQLSGDQRELLAQMSCMETRERSLLAEVIHDEPIQLIVAAILRIDLLSTRAHGQGVNTPSGGDSAELDRIATLLETSVDRLRRLIVALMPPDLTKGLGEALRDLAGGIFVGTSTEFRVVGPTHIRTTDAAKEASYRILREGLVNARKHARASTVTLHLEQRADAVVLTLTDDGVGSATLEGAAGHLGMATMRARANAEGGRLRCASEPGLGTTVELTLPTVGRDPAGAGANPSGGGRSE